VPDVSTVSDDALWCRTESHDWKWQRDVPHYDRHTFDRISTCERCGAGRVRIISTTSWTVIHRRIRYPKGYLVRGGRLTAADVFQEQFRRAA
jgi:hypothetical protein